MSSGSFSRALSMVIFSSSGMSLAMRSVSAKLMPSARPTSRTAALAFMVPKVVIWATRSCAVLLGHVADHLQAAAFAEVHVDIRHADAFDVQEALEQEVVGQGVEVGDLERPGHQRPGGRAAPRTHRDALVLGPVDEVLHDEEIGREAHVLDDLELVFQAVPVGLPRPPRRCMAARRLVRPSRAMRSNSSSMLTPSGRS